MIITLMVIMIRASIPEAPCISAAIEYHKYALDFPEEGYSLEISLFPDGHFIFAFDEYHEEGISIQVGKYDNNESLGEITFLYLDSTSLDFTARINADFSELNIEDDIFPGEVISEESFCEDEVIQTYLLDLFYDSSSMITVNIKADGTFEETCEFPGLGELYVEKGTWELYPESGCIHFNYDEWIEGNFYAQYHRSSRSILLIDGIYRPFD